MTKLSIELITTTADRYGVSGDIARSISTEIHPHDTMFNLNKDQNSYLQSGVQAFKAIQAALLLSQNDAPNSLLDFGCGHGRVGRWMRAAFPDAALTGAEILPSAVTFYAETFAARGWKTEPSVSLNYAEDRYDLIWAGSVITHLAERDAVTLIKNFISWLRPRGLVIFTTHGRPAVKIFRSAPPKRIQLDDLRQAFREFENDRFGYANYVNEKNYGHSFTPGRWLVNQILSGDDRLVFFSEGGWNGFQDVVAIQKP